MKYIFLLWFMLMWSSLFYSQTVTITDLNSEKPIEGVVLLSETSQVSLVTNSLGQADISTFAGSEKIYIKSLGYKAGILSYSQIQSLGFRIGLEHSNFNLDEIVVSATRWRQTSDHVPNKIISISPKKIALQNPQTAADLLGISGKVFIQKSQQGGGSPMIRGFATNRLLYAVDGIRMNTAIFRGGNLQNVINLDPFATENTEVLFGPGSVIYGSDAIGGVMSFQTLTPQLSLADHNLIKGHALIRYASANDEKTGHFDVNVGSKKWAFVTSLSSWDFKHLRQGSNGPVDYLKNIYPQRQDNKDVVITQDDPLLQIPSAYSQLNLMQKIRFKPNEKWDFQYGFHFSETSSYGRYDRHNRFRNGTLRYAEWNYGPQFWMMNNLNISYKGTHPVYDQISIRLAQQSFEESRIDRTLNMVERNTQTENVEAYSVYLDFNKLLNAKNTVFYGVEYVVNDVASGGMLTDITSGIDQKGPARYPQSTWKSIGIYLNDQFKVSNKWMLQAGIRYNLFLLDAKFDTTFYPFPFTSAAANNSALTGSMGFVYKPSEEWVISANAGTAFRSPNVDDMGKVFDPEPGTVTVPNPDLKEEYAYNFDLGVAKVFGEVIKVDMTGYYTHLQNALVRRDFQLNGQDSLLYNGELSKVQAIQNAAVAYVYGVQAGIEIKLPSNFSILSDLNYQIGEEELDDGSTSKSRHAAPIFGMSRLRYQQDQLTLEFNASYQGEKSFKDLPLEEQAKDEIYAKDPDGNNYSPAWYTINVKALYQLTDQFNISCGVENLTDRRYRPYSSGISGAGRNFIISLRAGF